MNYKNIIFDYDYTLYDKEYFDLSNENIKIVNELATNDLKIIILSGNSMSHISNKFKNMIIFSNHGQIENTINDNIIVKSTYLYPSNLLNTIDKEYIYDIIKKLSLNNINIEDKNSISISLKPIINRKQVIDNIEQINKRSDIIAVRSGKTTIEFIKKNVNKKDILNEYIKNVPNCLYISDMNDIDYNINTTTYSFVNINDIIQTNILLKMYKNNILYDAAIIVGGLNKRMNLNYPKSLIKYKNGRTNIENIIDQIRPYTKNIYIVTNEIYLPYYEQLKITSNNIFIKHYSAMHNLNKYPNGTGEIILQFLNENNKMLTNKLYILWGDVVINNNGIMNEFQYYQNISDFIIPVAQEENPYAYVITTLNQSCQKFDYQNKHPIRDGYHDMSIFMINTHLVHKYLKELYDEKIKNIKEYNNHEFNFLDIVEYLFDHKIEPKYFVTKYPTKSFNTIEEFNIINNMTI